MKRILIFIGLKLWEVGKGTLIFCCGVLIASFISGVLLMPAILLWKFFDAPFWVGLSACLAWAGLFIVIALRSEIKEWLKANWQKAREIAEGER